MNTMLVLMGVHIAGAAFMATRFHWGRMPGLVARLGAIWLVVFWPVTAAAWIYQDWGSSDD